MSQIPAILIRTRTNSVIESFLTSFLYSVNDTRYSAGVFTHASCRLMFLLLFFRVSLTECKNDLLKLSNKVNRSSRGYALGLLGRASRPQSNNLASTCFVPVPLLGQRYAVWDTVRHLRVVSSCKRSKSPGFYKCLREFLKKKKTYLAKEKGKEQHVTDPLQTFCLLLNDKRFDRQWYSARLFAFLLLCFCTKSSQKWFDMRVCFIERQQGLISFDDFCAFLVTDILRKARCVLLCLRSCFDILIGRWHHLFGYRTVIKESGLALRFLSFQ